MTHLEGDGVDLLGDVVQGDLECVEVVGRQALRHVRRVRQTVYEGGVALQLGRLARQHHQHETATQKLHVPPITSRGRQKSAPHSRFKQVKVFKYAKEYHC